MNGFHIGRNYDRLQIAAEIEGLFFDCGHTIRNDAFLASIEKAFPILAQETVSACGIDAIFLIDEDFLDIARPSEGISSDRKKILSEGEFLQSGAVGKSIVFDGEKAVWKTDFLQVEAGEEGLASNSENSFLEDGILTSKDDPFFIFFDEGVVLCFIDGVFSGDGDGFYTCTSAEGTILDGG